MMSICLYIFYVHVILMICFYSMLQHITSPVGYGKYTYASSSDKTVDKSDDGSDKAASGGSYYSKAFRDVCTETFAAAMTYSSGSGDDDEGDPGESETVEARAGQTGSVSVSSKSTQSPGGKVDVDGRSVGDTTATTTGEPIHVVSPLLETKVMIERIIGASL